MRYRHILLFAAACLFASAILAQPAFETGDVVVQASAQSQLPGSPDGAFLTISDAFGLTKTVERRPELSPFAGGLLFLDPQQVFVSSRAGVKLWRDGFSVRSSSLDRLNLQAPGEILRTASGDLLVAETYRFGGLPRIVRFNTAGEVLWVYELTDAPGMLPASPNSYVGAEHTELLRDQCSLLWTTGPRAGFRNARVRVLDVCTGRAAADFTTGAIQQPMGIRALPNGDVLIATPEKIRRFNAAGKEIAEYRAPVPFLRWPVSGQMLLALTPDGSGFWAATENVIQRIDFASPEGIAAYLRTTYDFGTINVLSVVGEWRAALHPPRRRSAR